MKISKENFINYLVDVLGNDEDEAKKMFTLYGTAYLTAKELTDIYLTLITMNLKNYKNAEHFADNFIKDIAKENYNIYNANVYNQIKKITKLSGYKTDWLPNKIKTLSDDDRKNIISQYPKLIKIFSQSYNWGKTEYTPKKKDVERQILFRHFLIEYKKLEKINAIKYYNINNQ